MALSQTASAADMLFWNDLDSEQIMSMPLDGSQAPTALNIAPATVNGDPQFDSPGSLDYDPETGTLYWPNTGVPANVSSAGADGSGGGVLGNVTNPVQPPLGLSLDGGTDTLYLTGGIGQSIATMGLDGTQGSWALNDDDFRFGVLADEQGGTLWAAGPEWVSHGKLDGTGSLNTYSPQAVLNGGFSVDRDADRLYGTWYPGPGEGTDLAWMATDASSDGTLTPTGVDVIMASSTAIDHDTGSIYWANATPYGEIEETRGIFEMPLAGGAGSQVASAEQVGGRSGGLLILKQPQATSAPVLTGDTETGGTLTCGGATFAGDRPEAHYFRSPVTEVVNWYWEGNQIGIHTDTLKTLVSGKFRCERSGTNAAGTAGAVSNEFVVKNPDPVCPAIRLDVGVSKFTPAKPYGRKNTPGVRVTFKTSGNLVVSLQPKITFHGKEGSRVGTLRKHQFKVRSRQRMRFILPDALRRQIAGERGEVRLAPVTFSARATIWQPGARDCAQDRNLKLKTRVYYVSKRVGLRKLG